VLGVRYSERLFIFLLAVLVGFGCGKDASEPSRTYLFLGHPYDWNNGYRIDPRLETLDFARFDQVWLGGDVCSRTTERQETMEYLDSLLYFYNGHVQWTLGNHDVMYGNLEWIKEKTGRNSFYTTGLEGGITLLVLNTNLFWMYPAGPPQEQCRERQAQMDLMLSVLDTIRESSYLVILHHHALLTALKPDSLRESFNINPETVTISCDPSDLFDSRIYPRLVAAQQRNVQVILVGGDIGMKAKKMEYRLPEGIWLLGSGITNSLKRENAPEYVTTFDPDQVLLFHHDLKNRELSWEFVVLNDWLETVR